MSIIRLQNNEFERYCPHCKEVKPIAEFYNGKGKCIQCVREYGAEYRENNKEKIRERKKKYHSTYKRRYNPESTRKRYLKTRDYHIAYWTKYSREKRKSDIKFSIDERMSRSIRKALKNTGYNKNNVGWNQFVDYTIEELKNHLKRKFKRGMTWDKFLKGEIHIDHKIPRSAFHYNSPNDIDFKRCWSLDNLQPMWAKDNLTKGDKLNKPFQPSLKIAI